MQSICTALYLQSVQVREIWQKGEFVIAEVVVNGESDLLVDHVHAIVVGNTTSSSVEQVLRNAGSTTVVVMCRSDTHTA